MNENDVVIDGMDLVKDFYTKMSVIRKSKANNPNDRESMEWVANDKDDELSFVSCTSMTTCTSSEEDKSSTCSDTEVHSIQSVDSSRADCFSAPAKPLVQHSQYITWNGRRGLRRKLEPLVRHLTEMLCD